ncbi:Oidioi.mRNA.OKI2018_I69.chr2.g5876.t1.cds [Oikopleura dioica]|uniref:Oidioi.mRNA.OKI2018_I69.chr2.g5876.t1.cds n=1 Tax=Oikopleura dioica TaxID=34765 RepID=A0ABN7T1N7_OIKDI|nr:Oidioi.mRNA.OKI2018_I69.chr2.g5876.t1.cds [Oikopleura dioica]
MSQKSISDIFPPRKRPRPEDDEEVSEVDNPGPQKEWRPIRDQAESLREEFQRDPAFLGMAGFEGEYVIASSQFTGNIRCTAENCPNRSSFRGIAKGKPKKDRMRDHLKAHHLRSTRPQTQPSINPIVNLRNKNPFKPTAKQKEAVADCEAKALASLHLPQGFFGSQHIRERDRLLLTISNCDPNQLELLGGKNKKSMKTNLNNSSLKVKNAIIEAVELFDLPSSYGDSINTFIENMRKPKERPDQDKPKKWNHFLEERGDNPEEKDKIQIYRLKHPSSTETDESIKKKLETEKVSYTKIKSQYRGIRFSNNYDKFGTVLQYEHLIRSIQHGSLKEFSYLLENVDVPNFAFLNAIMFIYRHLHPLLRASEEKISSAAETVQILASVCSFAASVEKELTIKFGKDSSVTSIGAKLAKGLYYKASQMLFEGCWLEKRIKKNGIDDGPGIWKGQEPKRVWPIHHALLVLNFFKRNCKIVKLEDALSEAAKTDEFYRENLNYVQQQTKKWAQSGMEYLSALSKVLNESSIAEPELEEEINLEELNIAGNRIDPELLQESEVREPPPPKNDFELEVEAYKKLNLLQLVAWQKKIEKKNPRTNCESFFLREFWTSEFTKIYLFSKNARRLSLIAHRALLPSNESLQRQLPTWERINHDSRPKQLSSTDSEPRPTSSSSSSEQSASRTISLTLFSTVP